MRWCYYRYGYFSIAHSLVGIGTPMIDIIFSIANNVALTSKSKAGYDIELASLVFQPISAPWKYLQF